MPVLGKNIGGSSVIGSFFKSIKKKNPTNANADNNIKAYTKRIQKKFKEVKTFLEKNGFNPSAEGLMQDIISSQEYISKNDL